MKIGEHYDIPLIGFTEWQSLASACAVNPEILMNRLRHLADGLPEVIRAARDQALTEGLNHKVITDLATLLIRHVKDRRATLDADRNAAARAESQAKPTFPQMLTLTSARTRHRPRSREFDRRSDAVRNPAQAARSVSNGRSLATDFSVRAMTSRNLLVIGS
jgi:hypothetical protein